MPELPEVETTRRGILRHIVDKTICDVIIRQPRLRWPIPAQLHRHLVTQTVLAVQRRAKYLLLKLPTGTLIIHLGMSGSLRVVDPNIAPQKHDHVDILFSNHRCLRLRDPRRFGALLWTEGDVDQHPLLRDLGPEPLSDAFNAQYLYDQSRHRKLAIKQFLMDSHTVVGVGNIYANEALFLARIHPARSVCRISAQRYAQLVGVIKDVLVAAIDKGGTTLRDFTSAEGKPGYFRHALQVYNRAGQSCPICQCPIKKVMQGQRSTFYCARCQH